MTNTVQQEEQANPYNAKKDYHVEDTPFTPANQLYFEEPSEKNKLFDSDDITQVNSTANVNPLELLLTLVFPSIKFAITNLSAYDMPSTFN